MWLAKEVQPRLKGRGFLIRYADDAVFVFFREEDARRVLDVLPKRFGRYGLTLHPEKTRLVPFQRPPKYPLPKGSSGPTLPPGSFDFLGFTHVWTRSLERNWVIRRRTAKDRFARSFSRVWEWCRTHRHLPLEEQWRALVQKLRGHHGYYGIKSSSCSLERMRNGVVLAWE